MEPDLERRPLVALVGRPNVGKSSLFNRLVGSRLAIVEPTPGVTRDRLILPVRRERPDLSFDLMDTGGIGLVDRADLAASVELQVQTGLVRADLILFLVDAREGLTLLDEKVAGQVRRTGTPVLLLANKCESGAARLSLGEFARLGLDGPHPISAQEGQGLGELFEAMARHLPPGCGVAPAPGPELRLTIVGRRNTGKSSFVNRLLGEERVIVSEKAGTTRDSVDVDFTWEGRPLTLVDTAGIHRRTKVASAVEYFSLTRSDQAIRRADVVLFFLTLDQPVTRLDQELARIILDRYKPVVIVGTKSDLVPEEKPADFRARIEAQLPHLGASPVCRISNLTGRGMRGPLREAFRLRREAGQRVGTGVLNRKVDQIFRSLTFRGRGEKPRAFYATQLGVFPPTFLLFVNRPRLFEKEVLRAVAGQLRKRLGLERVPVRLVLRERPRRQISR